MNPVVDVQDVSFVVDHDVGIVTVLHLQEVSEQAVSGQTPHEVVDGLRVHQRIRRAERELEELPQTQIPTSAGPASHEGSESLLDLIQRLGILDELDQAAVSPCAHDLVGPQEDVQPLHLEHLLAVLD
eukprot:CAMPEP_0170124130 /NCGR_PEP_ID=MMETSP0020_2-20130122/18005_1 /TAXON_ID=98059 /ORGANISM="Dinobryon sp., Strain UTEXLB2267" /LENGTH=127 /DNA_ID=CAMNT_0010356027 /DNA_START=292 /DNA_END=674 /DNA_ORIENTATION=-